MWGPAVYTFPRQQQPVYNSFTYGARTSSQLYERPQWTVHGATAGKTAPVWEQSQWANARASTTPGNPPEYKLQTFCDDPTVSNERQRVHSAPPIYGTPANLLKNNAYSMPRSGSFSSVQTGLSSNGGVATPATTTPNSYSAAEANANGGAENGSSYNTRYGWYTHNNNNFFAKPSNDAQWSTDSYAPSSQLENAHGSFYQQQRQNAGNGGMMRTNSGYGGNMLTRHNSAYGNLQRVNSGFGLQRMDSGFGSRLQRTNSNFANGGSAFSLSRTNSGFDTFSAPTGKDAFERQNSFTRSDHSGHGGAYGDTRTKGIANNGFTHGGSFNGAPALEAYGSMYNFGLSNNDPLSRQDSFSTLSTQRSFGSLGGTRGSFGNMSFTGSSLYGANNLPHQNDFGSFYNGMNGTNNGTGSLYGIQNYGSTVGLNGAASSPPDDVNSTFGFGALGVPAVEEQVSSGNAEETPTEVSNSPATTTPAFPSRMTNQDMYSQHRSSTNGFTISRSNSFTGNQQVTPGSSLPTDQQPAEQTQTQSSANLNQNQTSRFYFPPARSENDSSSLQQRLPSTTRRQSQRGSEQKPYIGTGFRNTPQGSLRSNSRNRLQQMQKNGYGAPGEQSVTTILDPEFANGIGRSRNGGRRITFSGEQRM